MFPAIVRRPASGHRAPGSSGPARSLPGSPRSRRPASPALVPRVGRALFALCGGAAILVGCPLYSGDCDSQNDCASGFYCDRFSQRCEPTLDAIGCVRPSQCEVGETCTPERVCRPGSCDFHGCVRGYRCDVVDSAHACVPAVDEAPLDASAPSPPPDASLDASAGAVDSGVSAGDAGDASDASL